MEETLELIPDVWDYVFLLRDRLVREERETWVTEHVDKFTPVTSAVLWRVQKWKSRYIQQHNDTNPSLRLMNTKRSHMWVYQLQYR